MSRPSSRLGEAALKRMYTPIQLKNALDAQRGSGARLGHELARLGYIEESELTSFCPNNMACPASTSKVLRFPKKCSNW